MHVAIFSLHSFGSWSFLGIASVAYGTSDGVVGIVKVKQQLRDTEGAGFAFDIATTIETGHSVIRETRRAGLTALEWIYLPDRVRRLFFS